MERDEIIIRGQHQRIALLEEELRVLKMNYDE